MWQPWDVFSVPHNLGRTNVAFKETFFPKNIQFWFNHTVAQVTFSPYQYLFL